jgi:valyl-tRNA synthetase
MLFSGIEFTRRPPFRDVLIHATILTKDGKRMSKSLGTGIDPMDLIGRFGADATRFGLIWQTMGNQDVHWSEDHVVAGKKFANKIWNAARFVLAQQSTANSQQSTKLKPKTAEDKKILAALKKTKKEVSRLIDGYEFGQALHTLYDFFWHTFCDQYLEASKSQLDNPKLKISTEQTLLFVLSDSLKLIHPFMPFVTETIWRHMPRQKKKLLLVEQWPKSHIT